MARKATICLTKEELWELICNFDASFQSGLPENALADRVSAKLDEAYKSL